MSDSLVLCYHAVSERWRADLSVTPAALRAQLVQLRDAGYRGVTFGEAVDGPGGKAVAITFDDAFASVVALAKPVLDELGWKATIYPVTQHASQETPLAWSGTSQWLETEHARELDGLGWDALRELADAGWEVGSHTVTHPHLTTLSDADLEHELAASRAETEERLGRPCPSICYPYGDTDDRVVAAAAAAGYTTGAALPATWHAAERLRWPRVGVYHTDDLRRFRIKSARLTRAVRTRLGR